MVALSGIGCFSNVFPLVTRCKSLSFVTYNYTTKYYDIRLIYLSDDFHHFLQSPCVRLHQFIENENSLIALMLFSGNRLDNDFSRNICSLRHVYIRLEHERFKLSVSINGLIENKKKFEKKRYWKISVNGTIFLRSILQKDLTYTWNVIRQ